jgi:hypothetical protein
MNAIMLRRDSLSRSLRLWAGKGENFVILDEPIITSSKKLKWYSIMDHLSMFLVCLPP